MAFKAILVCASALLIQSISGSCVNRIAVPSCGCSTGNLLSSGNILSNGNLLSSGNILSNGNLLSSGNILSNGNLLASGNIASGNLLSGVSCLGLSNNGGAFNVQSIGPIVPAGIATATELALAADLAVSGTMPWLSAVEFCGELPTSGSGSVAYGCGDGNIGITTVNGGASPVRGVGGIGVGGIGVGGIGIGRLNTGCGCL